MRDELRDSAQVAGHHGNAAAERFQRGEPEALLLAGEQEDVGGGDQFLEAVLLAEERDAALQAHLPQHPLRGRALRTVSHHHQAAGTVTVDLGEDGDHVGDALHRPEVGDVDEHRLVVTQGGEERAQAGAVSHRGIAGGVHEVGDDVDGDALGNVEAPPRRAAQVGRRHRHRVASRDGEARNRQVAGVDSHQRGVRPVQRGDDSRRLVAQHLARHPRGGGVGHRVVDVQDVQALVAGDLDHLGGQRDGIGAGLLERRVVALRHLVEDDFPVRAMEAYRQVPSNEVDAVAPVRHRKANLRGDHAAATEGWKAGDGHVERGVHVRDGKNRGLAKLFLRKWSSGSASPNASRRM